MKRIVLAAAAILAGSFTLPAAAGSGVSVRVDLGWPAAVVYYDGHAHHHHRHHASYYNPYAQPVVVYREVRHDRHRGYRGRGHRHHDRHHHDDRYCRH